MITITDSTNTATFDGTTFASENPSFALWLNSTFVTPKPDDLTVALEAVGLTVTVAEVPDE